MNILTRLNLICILLLLPAPPAVCSDLEGVDDEPESGISDPRLWDAAGTVARTLRRLPSPRRHAADHRRAHIRSRIDSAPSTEGPRGSLAPRERSEVVREWNPLFTPRRSSAASGGPSRHEARSRRHLRAMALHELPADGGGEDPNLERAVDRGPIWIDSGLGYPAPPRGTEEAGGARRRLHSPIEYADEAHDAEAPSTDSESDFLPDPREGEPLAPPTPELRLAVIPAPAIEPLVDLQPLPEIANEMLTADALMHLLDHYDTRVALDPFLPEAEGDVLGRISAVIREDIHRAGTHHASLVAALSIVHAGSYQRRLFEQILSYYWAAGHR